MNDDRERPDRVLEVFLPAALGCRPRPSAAPAIMAAVRRQRMRHRALALVAAAAAIAIGVAIWRLAMGESAYPPPVAKGDFLILDGAEIRRGSLIYARQGGADLELGGYARVTMMPFRVARVVGEERAEAVALAAGEIACAVQSSSCRTFSVHTEWGTVSVVGTQFTVRVAAKEENMGRQRLFVNVLTGAVLLTTLSGSQALVRAGEEAAVDEKGVIAPAGEKTPQTNAEKERAALTAIRAFLRERLRQIETATMLDAEVAQARQAAEEAERAFHAKLKSDPGYKALEEEDARLEEERRVMQERIRGEGGDRQALFGEMWRIFQGRRDVRKRMAEFADTVPELAELKKKKQEAMANFWDKYQEKLQTNAEYPAISRSLQEIAGWMSDEGNDDGPPGWLRRMGRGDIGERPGERGRGRMPGGRRGQDGEQQQPPPGEQKGGEVF